ncbi:relaxase/mobilization nuclease domain-containing protein [Colwellia sp. PAMC 21821]|uniref:relaxase/mobilization nuclease domain-containing protein n=1 Tax=Colwellia sp. PAMC 21821 TaxID=1816219 RepID=UPI0009C11F55|nr:relaxase/mobilization nuclease domain-containing protein [Colwellia sp. PAMC 21821]ARD45913.1 hypothetical protein A3Q33_17415 [Colwellia sp. PAMC 21821]
MIIKLLKRDYKAVQNVRIEYVIGLSDDAKVEQVEWLGSNCITPSPIVIINDKKVIDKVILARLKQEMSLPNEFNQRAKNTSDHIVISLAKNEALSNEDWLLIINDYLDYMGYSGCSWIATKHNDTLQEHAHIVINNLKLDEENSRYVQVKSSNNQHRSMKARVNIERALQKKGLVISAAPTQKESPSKVVLSSRSKYCRQQVIRLKESVNTAQKEGASALTKVNIPAVQQSVNKLNHVVKSDIHYQNSQSKLIQLIKQAQTYALNKNKPVESFLLYLRSRQVSPHLQFRLDKNNEQKCINGISFLFKGCPYRGSKLEVSLGHEKFNKPFSAASLFSGINTQEHSQKLHFKQNEIERLTAISDRNYDVKRALSSVTFAEKENFIFPLAPDEEKVLMQTTRQINTAAHVLPSQTLPFPGTPPETAIQTLLPLSKKVHIPVKVAVNPVPIQTVQNTPSFTVDNSSQDFFPQTNFIVAELSPVMFKKLNALKQKTTEFRQNKKFDPNFMLFRRSQRCYFVLQPNWAETYSFIYKKDELVRQKRLTDKEIQRFVELLLALVKAFLQFVKELLGIPDTHLLGTVTNEKDPHVIDVKRQSAVDVKQLFDESDYHEREAQFNKLTPETFYVESIHNKRALAALFMSTLHNVPAHHWLTFYNVKHDNPLLKAIGQHAYEVCKQNALKIGNSVSDQSLSKDMLYYLSQNFGIIYEPDSAIGINNLKKEHIIKAVELAFESYQVELTIPVNVENNRKFESGPYTRYL